MKINKETWHYKIFTTYAIKASYNEPLTNFNFCYYFWQVMSGLFLTIPGIILIGVLFSLIFLDPIATAIALYTHHPDPSIYNYFQNPYFNGATLAVGIAAYGFLIRVFIDIFNEKYNLKKRFFNKLRFKKKFKPYKGPSIFYQYYKSVKDKVCPIVEIDNE